MPLWALSIRCGGRSRVASRTTSVCPSPTITSRCTRPWSAPRASTWSFSSISHWTYKEQGEIDETEKRVFTWLRQLLESHQDLTDNRQFMESVKLDLYSDVVYVFTPKGAVKELVKGATPIDFAYAIHTEIGDHCSGAKVNGTMVPLKYQLRSGDTVEISTSPTQVPHRDWLKFVRTPRAKNKIKHWLRVEEAKRSLELGKRLLERALRRHNVALGTLLKTTRVQEVARESGLPGVDELFAAIR